jgi:hypothetical protein
MKQIKFKQKRSIRTTVRTVMLLVVLFGLAPATQSQVTVGSTEPSVKGAILQLKEKANVTGDGYNAYRGLGLPRVRLSDKNELYPMFLTDPDSPYNSLTNQATPAYQTDGPALKAAHAGLIVYNLEQDDSKDLCLGLNQWDGTKWICFESKMGSAKFNTVNCSDITVNGVYVLNTSTTLQNYLTLNLNVTKTGIFNISVTSGNGYSFYLSGVASGLGPTSINIPCQGTPLVTGTNNLTFDGITLVGGCYPTATVVGAIANYSLNCSSIEVKGTYRKGTALNPTANTIEVMVTVATPGYYYITTPITNGIRFSKEGTFSTVGSPIVILEGSGTPTVNVDFSININANSAQGNDYCSAVIPVMLPSLTYAVIGQDNTHSWHAGVRNSALASTANFGPTGIVKIAGLSRLWSEATLSTAATNLNNASPKPDVVLYFAYGVAPDLNMAAALEYYVRQGGCVIYGAGSNSSSETNMVIDSVFHLNRPGAVSGLAISQTPSAPTLLTEADDVYPIANFTNDPIINGPFGSVADKHWAEDSLSIQSVVLAELPLHSVQICMARTELKNQHSEDYSIVWYNDAYNFVYFGDCTAAAMSASEVDFPSYYTTAGIPDTKFYGNGTYRRFIENSTLELNAVAWALKKAAISGINPH